MKIKLTVTTADRVSLALWLGNVWSMPGEGDDSLDAMEEIHRVLDLESITILRTEGSVSVKGLGNLEPQHAKTYELSPAALVALKDGFGPHQTPGQFGPVWLGPSKARLIRAVKRLLVEATPPAPAITKEAGDA